MLLVAAFGRLLRWWLLLVGVEVLAASVLAIVGLLLPAVLAKGNC